MTYLELFTSLSATFGGFQTGYKDSDYVAIGVPFDATSSYRPGSRFAPLAIRDASLNIETHSFRAEIDLEELKIHDAGDLHVTGDTDETLRRLELVIGETLNDRKTPFLIGGEHTIAFGAVKGIRSDLAVLSFDAHLDLRNEYLGRKVCHATFMRRIRETVNPLRIVEVGTRAVCREELEYARDNDVAYLTSQKILRVGAEKAAEEINGLLDGCDHVYLTVDMDVLDPAFAPAVQNPEPDGICAHLLLNLLSETCGRRVVAFDVTEVAPHYDMGVTTIQAAKTIFEILSCIHRDKQGS